LFQRIWVKHIQAEFTGIDVKIYKSFLNINANKTVFGGTIFSALDPIHSLLLDQIFKSKGMDNTIAWLKSAKIEYLRPGHTDLVFSVRLSPDEIENAYQAILTKGKIIQTFTTEIFDKNGVLCALSHNEIYIRNRSFTKKTKTATHELTNVH
jgi:acyl-coenzyme A thioesterase PaaI-like protein